MKATLYDVLGVDYEADQKAIKAAYRRKVKDCHPDIGGDPDEFQRVQRAYDVLSDPERRAKYDETGDDGDVKHEENKSVKIVASIFDRILDQKLPASEDYLRVMRMIIRNSIGEISKTLMENKLAKKRYEHLLKKFKNKKTPNDNLFKAALESRLQDCLKVEGGANDAKRNLEEALKFLEDYEFQPDPPQPDPPDGLDLAKNNPHAFFKSIFGEPWS